MNKEIIETARKVADLLERSDVSYSAPFTIRMLCEEIERMESTRDWTPCAEGLPGKETDNVLVCFLDKFGFMEVSIGWYWIPNEKWYTDAKSSPVDVIAWQPLPAAWKETENV